MPLQALLSNCHRTEAWSASALTANTGIMKKRKTRKAKAGTLLFTRFFLSLPLILSTAACSAAQTSGSLATATPLVPVPASSPASSSASQLPTEEVKLSAPATRAEAEEKLKNLVKSFEFSFKDSVQQNLSSGAQSYSYALYDVRHDACVSCANARRCRAASSIKPLIMARIFQRVEAGELCLDQEYLVDEAEVVGGAGSIITSSQRLFSLQRLLELMMHESDNSASNALVRLSGGLPALNHLAQALGLKNTHMGRLFMYPSDGEEIENWTSAEDLALLVARMHQGRLISPEADRAMVEIMSGDIAEEPFAERLGSEVLSSYAKGGLLAGSRSCVNVLDTRLGLLVMVGMEDGIAAEEGALEDMRAIGESVYRAYSGLLSTVSS